MALLERVSTLLRANLNDLLDKTEDPEKLSKQILLDMESQLLQVKTQVAVAIADQHRLSQQQAEHTAQQAQWRRKAELALSKGDGKGQDDLARAALERSLSHEQLAEGFAQQHADQTAEAETLRAAYNKLQGKLTETRARVELLLAQHRRNRALSKSTPQKAITESAEAASQMARLTRTVSDGKVNAETNRTVRAIASGDTLEDRFQTMEQEDRIESLLKELKQAQPNLALESPERT